MDKLSSFEDRLRDAGNTREFERVLDEYQDQSRRVDSELEKERLKQQQELERALKNRKGQRRATIEKEKAEALRQVQAEFEAASEKERRDVEELKALIKLEES